MDRSIYCGQVRSAHINDEVTLTGWVDRRRDHGGVIFLDLRDREGVVQVVFDSDAEAYFDLADSVRSEYVLKVTGKVRARSDATVNANMPTGEVEVYGTFLEILNTAQTPPFQMDEFVTVGEDVRLKYRYMDLRRNQMQKNLYFRSKVTSSIRNFLVDEGFLDIETPIMTRATPEGARDYLIPSRSSLYLFNDNIGRSNYSVRMCVNYFLNCFRKRFNSWNYFPYKSKYLLWRNSLDYFRNFNSYNFIWSYSKLLLAVLYRRICNFQ